MTGEGNWVGAEEYWVPVNYIHQFTSAGEIRRDFPFFRFIDFCNLLPLLSDISDVDVLLRVWGDCYDWKHSWPGASGLSWPENWETSSPTTRTVA